MTPGPIMAGLNKELRPGRQHAPRPRLADVEVS